MADKVAFRDGIARQPASLEDGRQAVLERLDTVDLAPLTHGTTVLTGIGASLYAAEAAAPQFRAQGLRAFATAATALLDGTVAAADVYVALSASGRSVEPTRAMAARPDALRIGIAKAAATPLADAVGTMVATGSGPDSSPNTTSFVGTLQTLGLIADRAGRPSGFDWARLPDAVQAMLPACRPAVGRAAALFAGRIAVDCVGAGPAYGIAGYLSLLLREAVRVAAQSWDTLNFLHGPLEPNDGRSGVLLIGRGREAQLAADLPEYGIPTVLVTDRTDIGDAHNRVVIPVPALAPGLPDAILQALPGQLLVADLMEAAGLPVCEFRYRQHDTKLAAPTR